MEKIKKYDRIELVDGAIIQHGTINRRIYLMNIGSANPETIVPRLIVLANRKKYSKIFAKIPSSKTPSFVSAGFQVEAEVPSFYLGVEPAQFLGYYLDNRRQLEADSEDLDNLVKLSLWREKTQQNKPLPGEVHIRRCVPDEAQMMNEIILKILIPNEIKKEFENAGHDL